MNKMCSRKSPPHSPSTSNRASFDECYSPSATSDRRFSTDSALYDMDISPILCTMSQRAQHFGVDVTWGSSSTLSPITVKPKRRHPMRKLLSPQKFVNKKMISQPKKGLYKYIEEMTKLNILTLSENISTGPTEHDTDNKIVSESKFDNSHQDIFMSCNIRQNNYNKFRDNLNSTDICYSTNVGNNDNNQTVINQNLNTTIQNEFLNNSDYDNELILCSQAMETKALNSETIQENIGRKSDISLENDSMDNVLALIPINDNSSFNENSPQSRRSIIERHKSMPCCSKVNLKSSITKRQSSMETKKSATSSFEKYYSASEHDSIDEILSKLDVDAIISRSTTLKRHSSLNIGNQKSDNFTKQKSMPICTNKSNKSLLESNSSPSSDSSSLSSSSYIRTKDLVAQNRRIAIEKRRKATLLLKKL